MDKTDKTIIIISVLVCIVILAITAGVTYYNVVTTRTAMQNGYEQVGRNGDWIKR